VLGYRLILVGIGIAFAVTAGTDHLMTSARIDDVQRAAVWLTGSLNNRTWDHARPLAIALLVLAVPTSVLGRQLRLLELGGDAAAALGARVSAARFGLLLVGVGFAALATAAAGPVAFVALLSPPITRRMVRAPGALLVPTALFGALLVVTADLVARRVMAPTELPVGIATAILGAPYLLWLLTRQVEAGAM
jgi:iron complex transport system permease protein